MFLRGSNVNILFEECIFNLDINNEKDIDKTEVNTLSELWLKFVWFNLKRKNLSPKTNKMMTIIQMDSQNQDVFFKSCIFFNSYNKVKFME